MRKKRKLKKEEKKTKKIEKETKPKAFCYKTAPVRPVTFETCRLVAREESSHSPAMPVSTQAVPLGRSGRGAEVLCSPSCLANLHLSSVSPAVTCPSFRLRCEETVKQEINTRHHG